MDIFDTLIHSGLKLKNGCIKMNWVMYLIICRKVLA